MEPIERRNLISDVTARIVELVVTSKPGTRLPSEREISEDLGVGRSTVREALRSLTFMGAVRVKQGEGIFVGNVDEAIFKKLITLGIMFRESKIHEVVEARTLLETAVAALAAERHDPNDRRTLSCLMDEMTAQKSNLEEASRLDLEFHVALARASHNTVLGYLVNAMRSLLEMWISKAFSNQQIAIDEIIKEHTAILEAVLERDARLAHRLMGEHLDEASNRLLRVIGPHHSLSRDVRSWMASEQI